MDTVTSAMALLALAVQYLPYILIVGAILSLIFGIFKKVIKLFVTLIWIYAFLWALSALLG